MFIIKTDVLPKTAFIKV